MAAQYREVMNVIGEDSRWLSINQCINLWRGELGEDKYTSYDVYVIFPESMDELTCDDVDVVESAITPIIENINLRKDLRKKLIEEKLQELPLEDGGWVIYGKNDLPSQMYNICFYANSTDLTYLDVPSEIVEEYFNKRYMGVSWRDTYTADDTVGLIEFAKERGWNLQE